MTPAAAAQAPSRGASAEEATRRFASGHGDMRLPADDFGPLLRRARLCSLKEGEAAFEQGSAPTGVYLVRDGVCQVEHTSKTNGTTVVGQLRSGDHFGEGALLEGRDRRNCTVRCVSDGGCGIGVLSKGAFEAMLHAQPSLQVAFEDALARRNRQRLRSMIQLAGERSECTTRTLRPGEVLFRQGDAAEAFFVVDRGAVQMSYRTTDGRQLPAKTHTTGDIFGASGLIAGASTRRDTAIATKETTLKVIPHARFISLMRHDSLLAEGVRRVTSLQAVRPTSKGGGGGGG